MDLLVVAAPNAFKGSLTPAKAAQAMAEGIRRIDPGIQVKMIPVSDGGDGLISALSLARETCLEKTNVHDPRFRPIPAAYLFMKEKSLAVIEMALASGLALLPPSLQDPFLTTTLGTGELVKAALDRGASQILMGIGGSATCDGGIGAAAALGYRFLDKDGTPLAPVGASLGLIHAIDSSKTDPRIAQTRFTVACDVTTPLTGPQGAARVFGPQKGANPDQVEALDQGLANLAQVIQRDLGRSILTLESAGAAGGLGGGMKAFFNATLCPGIDLVLDLVEFDRQIKGADLILTGEGRLDNQTQFNKAPAGVARAAKAANLPCMAICGSIAEETQPLNQLGLDAVFSLCQGPVSLDQAMRMAAPLLAATTEQAVRAFISGRKNHDRQ